MAKVILIVAFLTLTTGTSFAQTSQSKQDKEAVKQAAKQAERERKEQEKEAKRQEKYESTRPIKTTSFYDRFKDLTTVSMKNMLVIGNNNYTPVIYGIADFWLTGGFQYQGQTWTKPTQVALAFEALEAYWEFRNPGNRNLILIVDGTRMDLGMMASQESVVPYVGNKESLAVVLPYETFLRIANAKSVEAQLGRLEFRLEERHLAGLRNLITPGSAVDDGPPPTGRQLRRHSQSDHAASITDDAQQIVGRERRKRVS